MSFLHFDFKKFSLYCIQDFYSIVIMAACSADCTFTYLDIGAFGSEGDANIFRNSTFGANVIQDRLNFPEDKSIDGTVFPFYFVVDDAFPPCKRIIKPYGGNNLSKEQRVFNYRLSRARITIEQTFGILSAKWLCLRRTLFCNPNRAQKIVTACYLLDNFLMKKETSTYSSNNFKDDPQNQLRSMSGSSGRPADYARSMRDWLKDFVNNSSGRVPWQDKYAYVD